MCQDPIKVSLPQITICAVSQFRSLAELDNPGNVLFWLTLLCYFLSVLY